MEVSARAPIFKPIRARFMVTGLTAGAAVATLSVFAIGAALAVALGSWTHVADMPLTDGERAELVAEYRAVASQLASIEKQRQVDGAASYGDMALGDAQTRAVELAREWGIRPGMSRDELEALVPQTRSTEVENLPLLARVVLLVLAPTGAMYIALAEINRTSLTREAARAWRLARSQKDYPCAPREHLARAAEEERAEHCPGQRSGGLVARRLR